MKTNYIKTDWLTLLLGIALVAGLAMAAATYLNLERKVHFAEVFVANCDRLYLDVQLCSALKAIHEGDISGATRRLDLKLCQDIIALNRQLASGDAGDRAFIKNAFVRFTLLRPRSAELLTDDAEELKSEQVEAERILQEACDGS
jgi:hypothetical protein